MDDTVSVSNSSLSFLNATVTEGAPDDSYEVMKIVSSLVVVAVVLLACALGYLAYRKICKSHDSKHGVEREEVGPKGARGRGKAEYYDQFGCDTNELTVNSVTAITWEEEAKRRPRKAAANSGSRSSGVDCDMHSDDANGVQINSGKRVFQVNRVSANGDRQRVASGAKVIRLPKGFAEAARSLQASDGRNFTLAVIDRNSKTIHNIDLRTQRNVTRAKSPLVGDGPVSPRTVPPRNRTTNTSSDNSCHSCHKPSGANRGMVHDSPDLPRKAGASRVSGSVDELMRESSDSSTDASDTNCPTRSISLSSKESSDPDPDFTAKLLPSGPPYPRPVAAINSL